MFKLCNKPCKYLLQDEKFKTQIFIIKIVTDMEHLQNAKSVLMQTISYVPFNSVLQYVMNDEVNSGIRVKELVLNSSITADRAMPFVIRDRSEAVPRDTRARSHVLFRVTSVWW